LRRVEHLASRTVRSAAEERGAGLTMQRNTLRAPRAQDDMVADRNVLGECRRDHDEHE